MNKKSNNCGCLQCAIISYAFCIGTIICCYIMGKFPSLSYQIKLILGIMLILGSFYLIHKIDKIPLATQKMIALVAVLFAIPIFVSEILNEAKLFASGGVWVDFFGSYIGAFASGVVAIYVMIGTLKHNEKMQDEKKTDDAKENAKKLMLLWKQQKYEIEGIYREWSASKKPLRMDITVLGLKNELDLMGKIIDIDEDDAVNIMDFNSNLRVLNQRRQKYVEICNIFEVNVNQPKKIHEQKRIAQIEYGQVVEIVNKQVKKINDIIEKLQEEIESKAA